MPLNRFRSLKFLLFPANLFKPLACETSVLARSSSLRDVCVWENFWVTSMLARRLCLRRVCPCACETSVLVRCLSLRDVCACETSVLARRLSLHVCAFQTSVFARHGRHFYYCFSFLLVILFYLPLCTGFVYFCYRLRVQLKLKGGRKGQETGQRTTTENPKSKTESE